MNIEEKENLYIKAKAEYYKGTPIMSDFEFDTLEEELKLENSTIVELVDGDVSPGERYPHMNPMLSLEKLQVMDETEFPVDDLQLFFNKRPDKRNYIEATPKFDGSAMSLKYVDGVLVQALTRGGSDSKGGLDKTDKLKLLVPVTIDIMGTVEIRGEIVIDTEVFAKKYSIKYKNERNFVAGIMNKDTEWEDIVPDFEFVAYHLVRDADTRPAHQENTMDKLFELGFNRYHAPMVIESSSALEFFKSAYFEFKKYRESICPYRLDGIVLKMNSDCREQMGENNHHPKWALAIKFPPDEQITKINDIIWQLGPSGAMTPIAALEPINLDGTTVKQASLHNLGKIEENECWPGATVIIAKKGDIIPQVIKVVTGASTKSKIPTNCPECNEDLAISESKTSKQLYCPNEECEGKAIMKLAQGIKILGIERIGDATAVELYNAGIKNLCDLFNPMKLNRAELIESGIFKDGRSLDIILEGIENIKEVQIDKVINALKFTDSGSSISREVGKYMSNVPHSFFGLNKTVVHKLTSETSKEYRMIHELIRALTSAGVRVVLFEEEILNEDIKFYEMTGSPKPFFSTKGEFTEFSSNKNFKHSKLNDSCKYLLTDSYSSSSSKMKKAAKLGVEIITYEDFQNKYK